MPRHSGTHLIPLLGRKRQADLCAFKASLDYTVRPSHKSKNTRKSKNVLLEIKDGINNGFPDFFYFYANLKQLICLPTSFYLSKT